jgi:DNA-binding transcriptional LysR family regulator
VTRSVSDLEDHLGVRLLNRTTRSLALTEAGEAYLERAKLVLSALDEADSLASAFNGAPAGNLRILCPPAFATHQLVPRLPAFRLRYPGIQIEMSAVGPVGSADENFDVSIVSVGQQTFQGDFVVRQLASSRFIVCAAPDYLARSRPILQPLDLLPHDVLFPQVAAVRRELTLYSETPALNPSEEVLRVHLHPPVISTSQLEVLYAAALAGMGVAGLPTFMVADALKDGRLTRVLPDWHGGALQLYAAMPTRKHVPTRTRAFVDFLVEAFGGNQKDPWLGLT